jgi:tetratricopeptide (TPR) repeat protein
MKNYKNAMRQAGILMTMGFILASAAAEPLRDLAPGDKLPDYRLTTMTGNTVDSTHSNGKAVVMIYIVARQPGSQQAATDANLVFQNFNDLPIELLFVTANTNQQSYFEQFWKDNEIHAPLAYDSGRKLYAQLGLIAFPSTVIVDKDGKLTHSLSTYSTNYPHVLEGYIRHTLGQIDDDGLEEHLKSRPSPKTTAKDLAMRHRATARHMLEKGFSETAESELLKAKGIDPDNIDVRLDLADLFLKSGRIGEADSYVNETLEMDADHRRAKLMKGIVLYRQNRLDESRSVLTDTLILNPDPARTHYYLGLVYEALGNKDQAIEHYRQSLERLLNEPSE